MFIRVHVESRELELQSNSEPLLLASLQSAFPGAVGLYVQDSGTQSKRVLHFDGNSFHAPAEGWTSVQDYEVTLGGQNSIPFHCYEKASKQLEQTVRTIQTLMAQNEESMNLLNENNNIQMTPPRDRRGSFRNRTATFKNSQNASQLELWLPRKGCDELERQFAELSAIVAGKDLIIQSLRKQVQTERSTNEQLERRVLLNSNIKLESEEWQLKWKSLDFELRLLRELGGRQECFGQKIKLLNSELENVKNSSNTKIQQIQETLIEVQNELKLTTSKYEQLRLDYDSTVIECRAKESQLEDLRSRLSAVTSELTAHRDQAAQQAECSHDLQERLCKENIALAEWSKKLELENKEHEAELDRVRKDFKVQQNQLQESYDEKCQQSAHMHELVESLNKSLIELSRKQDELRESFRNTPSSPRVDGNSDQNPVVLI